MLRGVKCETGHRRSAFRSGDPYAEPGTRNGTPIRNRDDFTIKARGGTPGKQESLALSRLRILRYRTQPRQDPDD